MTSTIFMILLALLLSDILISYKLYKQKITNNKYVEKLNNTILILKEDIMKINITLDDKIKQFIITTLKDLKNSRKKIIVKKNTTVKSDNG